MKVYEKNARDYVRKTAKDAHDPETDYIAGFLAATEMLRSDAAAYDLDGPNHEGWRGPNWVAKWLERERE